MATADGQSSGNKIVNGVNDVANIVGTLFPAVAAIGTMVRLIAMEVRPSDAQKAQSFDAAIAEVDQKISGLNDAIAGFDAAKATAEGNTAKAPGVNAVGAMTAKTTSAPKPSDG
jgi:hypothetical protein